MRRLRKAGSGSSAAIFSRAVRFGVSASASKPAANAGRRQGWALEAWRGLLRSARAAAPRPLPPAPGPRAPAGAVADDRLHATAALAGDELLVLLGQAPPGAEE